MQSIKRSEHYRQGRYQVEIKWQNAFLKKRFLSPILPLPLSLSYSVFFFFIVYRPHVQPMTLCIQLRLTVQFTDFNNNVKFTSPERNLESSAIRNFRRRDCYSHTTIFRNAPSIICDAASLLFSQIAISLSRVSEFSALLNFLYFATSGKTARPNYPVDNAQYVLLNNARNEWISSKIFDNK